MKYDTEKVKIISTYLGDVRFLKDKQLYIMSDLIRALGLTKRNAITLKVSSDTYRLISYEQSISYGLRPMRMGYNAISYAGIEEYAKLKRVKVDWDRFLRELLPQRNDGLQIFNNEEFGQVRTVTKDSEVWFVGKDVAECLGYKNTRDALNVHVDKEDKADVVIHDGSQNRNMIGINESGLYSLILSSKLPTAKKFKHWVTSEVLPSIRKTGGYVNNSKKFINNYLHIFSTALRKEMIKELDSKIKTLSNVKEKIDKELLEKINAIDEIKNTL